MFKEAAVMTAAWFRGYAAVRRAVVLGCACALFIAAGCGQSTGNHEKEEKNMTTTVYLAGDSTMARYSPNQAPLMGWGQQLEDFFDEDVAIRNEAASGRSSKSFISEGRLERILEDIAAGDYLFIQFAHNDQKSEDASRYTDPATTFPEHLMQYIDGARAKGAFPVLVTPVQRRAFGSGGAVSPSHGAYRNAMIKLAQEQNVPVIDLFEKSRVLLESLGLEASKALYLWLEPGEHPNHPEGAQDNTHFNERGALEMARLVTDGIRELKLPLAVHLR